jgi:hypothetical protein
MKAIKFNVLLLSGILLLLFALKACKDDELEVPLASTQANFDYEVSVIVVDEELGIEHFEVELFNNSLMAKSYHWDFSNGETSTEKDPVVVYTTAGRYTITLSVTPTNEGLHYNKLSESVNLALGKQVLLSEDFNEGIDFLDEDTWAPEGWQTVDKDGDGINWYVGLRQDVLSMRSQSWDGAPLTPDNWLITPEINLLDYDQHATITFRYTVGVTATTPIYRQEHYGVFIAIGNDNLDSFESVFEETFTTETPNWEPQERNLDLKDFAGQIIYLAFRHYNVTDMDRIFIEEVELYVIE